METKFTAKEINQIAKVYENALDEFNVSRARSFLGSAGTDSSKWSEDQWETYSQLAEPLVELKFGEFLNEELADVAFNEWENICATGDYDKTIEIFNKYGAIPCSPDWETTTKFLKLLSTVGY